MVFYIDNLLGSKMREAAQADGVAVNTWLRSKLFPDLPKPPRGPQRRSLPKAAVRRRIPGQLSRPSLGDKYFLWAMPLGIVLRFEGYSQRRTQNKVSYMNERFRRLGAWASGGDAPFRITGMRMDTIVRQASVPLVKFAANFRLPPDMDARLDKSTPGVWIVKPFKKPSY